MKSIAEHKADGTFRADRHGDYEPSDGVPIAPDSLSGDALELFRELAETLAAEGGVCPLDAKALAELCSMSVEVAKLRAVIAEHGYTFRSDKGNVIQRPEVGILNQMMSHYIKLLQQFGLTPKGRVGLKSTKPASDPLAERLKGRGVSIG